MRLPAQRAQHPDGIAGAVGLSQHLSLEHDDRICSDNHPFRDTLRDVQRLLESKRGGVFFRRAGRVKYLRNVAGHDSRAHADLFKQLKSSG